MARPARPFRRERAQDRRPKRRLEAARSYEQSGACTHNGANVRFWILSRDLPLDQSIAGFDPQQTAPRDRSCFLPKLHSARSFSLLEFRPLRNSKGGTTMKIGRALLLAGVAVAALSNW